VSWKVRHEGSPRSIEGLTLAQVAEGLQDGLWEPTDEVQGPGDRQWVAIESHPQLADVALELEPPPAPHRPDETHLDMNPLIDVCLVLLIFFILTTSYAALQKVLDTPTSRHAENNKLPVKEVPADKAREFMIRVEARQVDGRPVLKVEDQEVDRNELMGEIKRWKARTHKAELLIDAADDVDWDTIVKIRDAAQGAEIGKVYFATKAEEVPVPPKD
jgi:biopolymer transport protein ExbD